MFVIVEVFTLLVCLWFFIPQFMLDKPANIVVVVRLSLIHI